ncbi:MAG: type II toxin-antitoxin system CcdA family antitoxin [Rhizomicrobium sp.]
MTKKRLEDPARRFRDAEPKTLKAGSKRAVNVSVDTDILDMAKAMNINLSQTLEEALRRRTQDERDRRFQDEHRGAIEAHNRFIEKNGIWSKKYRSW